MPKRTDIKSILIIGAGPIVIGQACEFDYSGTQAVKALKEEGYRVILVNSNPATIMTDPGLADATYIEPITPEVVAKIIARERPDALLPTMGGQTALNTALSLKRMGVLERYNVEMIGAKPAAIDMAEDRALFREAMGRIGLETPRSFLANATEIKDTDRKLHEAERKILRDKLSGDALDTALDALENTWNLGESDRKQRYMSHAMAQAVQALDLIGLPAIIRPSFTMGGTGGGIAYNRSEFFDIIESGLDASPTTEVLIEESVLGWKEYEMEVVRDTADNCIIICSIENLDPMGVHTGDSITVAPALTLTDKEYPDHAQRLDRGAARDRGGDRRLQRAVRGQPEGWPPGGHRDEPARLALVCPGVKSHRLPDRQGRRQARRRLHARRTRKRHHPGRHARLVRTLDRLRRHQDPALCLREIPRRRTALDHRDEIRGRSDGHRPHLRRKPAEGAARARDRSHRPRRDRDPGPRRRRRRQRHQGRHRHARRPTGSGWWRRRFGSA